MRHHSRTGIRLTEPKRFPHSTKIAVTLATSAAPKVAHLPNGKNYKKCNEARKTFAARAAKDSSPQRRRHQCRDGPARSTGQVGPAVTDPCTVPTATGTEILVVDADPHAATSITTATLQMTTAENRICFGSFRFLRLCKSSLRSGVSANTRSPARAAW
jgi:hypothetical protein